MDITRYMDLSFKSIPKNSPIPPNSFALLRGQYILEDLESGTQFVICKNKEELVIKGPPLKGVPGIEDMSDYDMAEILKKEFAEWVTIIVHLLRPLDILATADLSYRRILPQLWSSGSPTTHSWSLILIPRGIKSSSTTKKNSVAFPVRYGRL